jgi:hypothetical protein
MASTMNLINNKHAMILQTMKMVVACRRQLSSSFFYASFWASTPNTQTNKHPIALFS